MRVVHTDIGCNMLALESGGIPAFNIGALSNLYLIIFVTGAQAHQVAPRPMAGAYHPFGWKISLQSCAGATLADLWSASIGLGPA